MISSCVSQSSFFEKLFSSALTAMRLNGLDDPYQESQQQRQEDCCEFKASMFHRASSRPGRDIQRAPLSLITENTKINK